MQAKEVVKARISPGFPVCTELGMWVGLAYIVIPGSSPHRGPKLQPLATTRVIRQDVHGAAGNVYRVF
jgi:hypothetical protein